MKNHIKGIMQRKDHRGFLPVFKAGFAAHVGVNQAEGFSGKCVQFQVPGGVIGCDMADGRHAAVFQPMPGVIVMEVRNIFSLPASVFPDVVSGCRGTDQREVDVFTAAVDRPGNSQGDVMHARDMAERTEGRDFIADAHQFIDIFVPERIQKAAVFRGTVADFVFFRRQESEVPRGVKGEYAVFIVQHCLENDQIALQSLMIICCIGKRVDLRVHAGPQGLKSQGAPSLHGRFPQQR